MPVHNPPPPAGGSGDVTVDADGYITVVGSTSFAFKDVEEDLGGGIIRIHHKVKHPTLGEITVAFNDTPTP
jgi:hypothetical protein